ncbi:MAG TPA: hypothetical protein VFJ09_02520 [Nocardioidaceae bacterium]|nr:hypothetical protein [Nocardioidaceae bacterium]
MPTVPEPFQRLVDDAAIFPPGNAPLPDAVQAHDSHRSSEHADLLGPFVVDDVRLPRLGELTEGRAEPLPVAVVVTGGAGAIGPAATWAARTASLDLRGLEIALRDEADLGHNARRVVTAVDQLVADGVVDEDVAVYVEPPALRGREPSPTWLAALDEVAAMDHRLKFRTGGPDHDAFPTAADLAGCIGGALDRELRFKCTAGLHNALRHRDPDTGFEHHGFLNVLLATRASLDGADGAEVAAVLERTDPGAVSTALQQAGTGGLVAARRWFTSFGSCSVLEPLEDLAALDLIILPTASENP